MDLNLNFYQREFFTKEKAPIILMALHSAQAINFRFCKMKIL
jgi:hypothetical protein